MKNVLLTLPIMSQFLFGGIASASETVEIKPAIAYSALPDNVAVEYITEEEHEYTVVTYVRTYSNECLVTNPESLTAVANYTKNGDEYSADVLLGLVPKDSDLKICPTIYKPVDVKYKITLDGTWKNLTLNGKKIELK